MKFKTIIRLIFMALFCSNCHKLLPAGSGKVTRVKDDSERSLCSSCIKIMNSEPAPQVQSSESTELFPFETFREGQVELMESVFAVMSENKNIVFHAPTGLGKTVSVLTPGLKFALNTNKKLFFLTSRQTQHRIAIETLKAIKEKQGADISVIDIVSKHKMCPRKNEFRNIPYSLFNELCKNEIARHRCKYYNKTNSTSNQKILKSLFHADELIKHCKSKGLCPYKIAMELGKYAHVIICDYNYIFSDINEMILPKLEVEFSDLIVVVDEAHNLPERIRSHLTFQFNPDRLAALVPSIKAKDKFLGRLISEISTLMLSAFDNVEEGNAILLPRAGLLGKIDGILHSSIDRPMELKEFNNHIITLTSAMAANSAIKAQLLKLSVFLHNWEHSDTSSIRYAQWSGDERKLVVKIQDPAHFSGPVFDSVHSAVLMSGTLYPPKMYADLLGLSEKNSIFKEFKSPFPKENRLVFVDPSVTTTYAQRNMDMYYRISTQIHSVLQVQRGNTAVFFTSYEFLKNIKILLEQHPLDKKVFVEKQGSAASGKSSILKSLKLHKKKGKGAVLLAVLGGSLSEGIDYPGSLLNGIIVVGLPLPPPSLELEGLKQYYNEKFGADKGEDYSSILPSMNKVLQAAGRSIRSPTDKSIIILMDKRFNLKKYNRFFPDEFQMKNLEEFDEECKVFFSDE